MQIRRGCYLCNRKLGVTTCKRCARPVCEDDYDKKTGLCSMCMMPRHIKRG